MTLLTKQVETKWHGRTREHYEALGYVYTKQGDGFKVPVERLPSGSSVKVDVRCDYCNEVYRPSWKNFLTSREKGIEKDACGKGTCRAMKRTEIMQGYYTTVADIPELLSEWHESNDVSPSRVLSGSGTKYRWKCSTCSKTWKAEVKGRIRGRDCPHCVGRYTEPLNVTHPELIKEWSDKNELSPDEITAGSEKRIIWECKTCSYEWKAMVNNRTSLGNSCPVCNESKGEKLVAKILDELDVSYSREQSFPDLKGSRGWSLRYDFAILHESEPIALIEYDGKQHFEAIEHFGGEATLKRQQKHDRLKDDYARKRNIPLLRIRYDQSEEEVKKAVSEFTQIQKEYEKAV